MISSAEGDAVWEKYATDTFTKIKQVRTLNRHTQCMYVCMNICMFGCASCNVRINFLHINILNLIDFYFDLFIYVCMYVCMYI